MRQKYPDPALMAALRVIERELQEDGVRIGKFIAQGTSGTVFAGPRGVVYKVTHGWNSEIEFTDWIMSRAACGDWPPPGIVRTRKIHHYETAQEWMLAAEPVYIMERERLRDDDPRARRALTILQHSLLALTKPNAWDTYGNFMRLVADSEDLHEVVEAGVESLIKWKVAMVGTTPQVRRGVSDAIVLLTALRWFYIRGYRVLDLFDVSWVHPENVGFRGDTAVILDLGVFQRRPL